MEKSFQMVAKTYQGLEDVLRDELIALGAENVEMGRRMVTFEGDNEMMYKANLCCRTALRILKPIVKFTANDPDELYDAVRDYDWESLLGLDSTFAIDSTVNSNEFPHSKYVTYRVKDGIVDYFNDKYGRRPSIRLTGADLMLNVHILDNRVTISLDSSGEPLSHRGYREEQTEAPISEVLAAGIIMKTGWRGDCDFIDPMCGSGTFLIEAALIAANINPGIYRKSFAFEKWPDFDRDLFESIYNDDSEERTFAYKIYGGDIDPEAVAIARRNIHSAHVDDMIEIKCQSVTEWTDNAPEGVLVTNPPYGERLRPDDILTLYRNIGSTLKKYFKGWHAWVLGNKDEHFTAIGLKPSMKLPVLNGSLECSLREYVLFDGSYNDFRADGGSVGREENVHKEGPKKVRRISDDEWKKETRKFGSDRKHDRKHDRRQERERKEWGFSGNDDFKEKEFKSRGDRKDGGFKPRGDRKDGGFKPRGDRKDGGFKPRGDRKDGGFKPRKSDERRDYGVVRSVSDKGPSLPRESEYRFSDNKMRSRKGWKRNDSVASEED